MKNQEITTMTKTIIETNGGKAYFNFRQASKILGIGYNAVPAFLHDKGVLVQKMGTNKKVSAYDLAAVMYAGRVAPVD